MLPALNLAPPSLTLAQASLPGLAWGLIAAGALVVGLLVGAVGVKLLGKAGLDRAKAEAEQTLARAKTDGQAAAERIRLDAEKAALERKERVDAELESKRAEQRDLERRLSKREDLLDRRDETLGAKEQALADRQGELDRRLEKLGHREAEVEALVQKQTDELHRVAQIGPDQAKELLLQRVEDQTRAEVGKRVREINEEAEEGARARAHEVVLQAIQRYATETASESTVRTVDIPSDDMKGRIIGREGRNIRAIEKATGVDIIVDDTPGVIIVSCFDKVRQAIAVEALTRLVADGRMHPTRIEEVVEKTRAEIEERVVKEGKDAAVEVNLRGFHPKIIEAMGKLHYRTSYGQNVLRHSIEVAYFSQLIADQLGMDGRLARRCGFLHDIGKAMDHEMEGGHPKIGMDFAKQYGEKDEAVLNAIGGHHADIPSTTFYTPIVMAADAVSSARPGARRESMERYVQRLNELQDIALSQPGVVEAHAIQAGREVRVMIDADRVSDDEAYLIAHNIARRVSEEMTFPGEIRVTVLRETRAIEIAR
ncbi:MAG: ribonuclease Y [Phycisphaerales bacterium]